MTCLHELVWKTHPFARTNFRSKLGRGIKHFTGFVYHYKTFLLDLDFYISLDLSTIYFTHFSAC